MGDAISYLHLIFMGENADRSEDQHEARNIFYIARQGRAQRSKRSRPTVAISVRKINEEMGRMERNLLNDVEKGTEDSILREEGLYRA